MPNRSKIDDPRFWKKWAKAGSVVSYARGFATDGPVPPPCSQEILENGVLVFVTYGLGSNGTETWVKKVAKRSKQSVDWHFAGGRARILAIGDIEKVKQAIIDLMPDHDAAFYAATAYNRDYAPPRPDWWTGEPGPVVHVPVLREVDGQLVLDDPDAAAMFRAVSKHNCRSTFEMNADRVAHFKRRVAERGMTADQVLIVLLNVDDVHGGPLAEALMPGFDWQEIRARGEIPFARGLAGRDGIQEMLEAFDKEASIKLRDMTDVAVVVVDHGVAEVFSA